MYLYIYTRVYDLFVSTFTFCIPSISPKIKLHVKHNPSQTVCSNGVGDEICAFSTGNLYRIPAAEIIAIFI